MSNENWLREIGFKKRLFFTMWSEKLREIKNFDWKIIHKKQFKIPQIEWSIKLNVLCQFFLLSFFEINDVYTLYVSYLHQVHQKLIWILNFNNIFN